MVNKLTFISFHHKDERSNKWNLYQCSCGKQVVLREYAVKNGNTKSCGCLRKENAKKLVLTRLPHCLFRRTQKNNSSGVNGVSYDKIHKRWVAYLYYNHKQHKVYCKTKEEAIEIRKALEEKAGLFFGVDLNE